MPITSPRSSFRGLAPIPQDLPDIREWVSQIASILRQVQERIRLFQIEVVTTTVSYTMVDIDSLILGDATAASITVTLLTAAGREGRDIYVKKIDTSDNTVTIDAEGTETLDGSTTIVLTQRNAVRGYRSDGTNWRLISSLGNATTL